MQCCGSLVINQSKIDFCANISTSHQGKDLARKTSLIQPLLTTVVQSYNRGKYDMSMSIVLDHNTFNEPTTRKGMTQ